MVRPAVAKLAAGLAAAFLCVAGPARAETISAHFEGVQGTPAYVPSGAYAGVMRFTSPTHGHLANGTLIHFPGFSGPDFNTFCIDAGHGLTGNDFKVVYATPGTVSQWESTSNINGHGHDLLKLFGTFFNHLTDASLGGFGLSVNDQYAAFQIAIWKIENPSFDASHNSSSIQNLANYFVTHLGNTEATNLVILDQSYVDDSGHIHYGQNQIGVLDPVPAPPGLVMAAIGGVTLLGFGWRRRQLAVA